MMLDNVQKLIETKKRLNSDITLGVGFVITESTVDQVIGFAETFADFDLDYCQYIIIDQHIDYAIIEIEKVDGRTPVKLSEVIPSNREWRQETSESGHVFQLLGMLFRVFRGQKMDLDF